MNTSFLRIFACVVVCLEVTFGGAAAESESVRTIHPVERWRLPGSIDDDLFGKITSVVTDAAGNVFVFDVKKCRVHVLRGKDGSLLRSFGRCGEGPGDFYRGQMLFSSLEGGEVGVVNLMPPGIQFLTDNGVYVTTTDVRLEQKASLVTLNRVLPTASGFVAEGLANLPDMSQVRYLAILDESGTETVRLFSETVAEAGRTYVDEMLLNQPRWVVDPQGPVYLSGCYGEYYIEVLSVTGSKRRSIERKYDRSRRSKEEIDNLRRLEGTYKQKQASMGIELKNVDYHRDIEALFLIGGGRLLVLTSNGARSAGEPSAMGTFDVYDENAESLTVVRLVGQGNPLHDGFFFEGNLLFVVTDCLPPYRDCYRTLDRDLPYMSIICYDISELTGLN